MSMSAQQAGRWVLERPAKKEAVSPSHVILSQPERRRIYQVTRRRRECSISGLVGEQIFGRSFASLRMTGVEDDG